MASTIATIRRTAAGSSDAIPQPANSAMAGPTDAKYRGERKSTGVSADIRKSVTTGNSSQPARSTNVDDRAGTGAIRTRSRIRCEERAEEHRHDQYGRHQDDRESLHRRVARDR